MPELPEVETMRRGIAGVVGSRVASVEKVRCPRKPILFTPRSDSFRRRVAGRPITAVDRIGKRVLARLDSGDAIVFEPRMTGLVLTGASPDPVYLRVQIGLAGGDVDRLWYWDRRGLGNVRLLSPGEQRTVFGPDRLGPDGLVVTAADLRDRLRQS
ncbi:MAG: DNA-formamidopyrimidine glycosylase family protein, partial [Planctomycetota bacterium]